MQNDQETEAEKPKQKAMKPEKVHRDERASPLKFADSLSACF
jgi:hypothetical protein